MRVPKQAAGTGNDHSANNFMPAQHEGGGWRMASVAEQKVLTPSELLQAWH